MNMLVWHYTTYDRLERILAAGEIRPATAHVPPNERPIVWFSRNPVWEETATPALRDSSGRTRKATRDEMKRVARGMVRIGVDSSTAPFDWYQLKRRSGMKARIARGLEDAALREGSSSRDWCGTFDPVPRSQWISVEILDGDQWVPLSSIAPPMEGADEASAIEHQEP